MSKIKSKKTKSKRNKPRKKKIFRTPEIKCSWYDSEFQAYLQGDARNELDDP